MPEEYTILYSIFSLKDLNDIKAYLSNFYPSTPVKFLSEIKAKINLLKTRPKMFEVFSDESAYRKMPVGNYVVFYKLNEEEKSVFIYRILHGKQDSKNHL